jgi:hypothetical protein
MIAGAVAKPKVGTARMLRTLGGVSDHTTGESLLGSFRLRAFNLSSI